MRMIIRMMHKSRTSHIRRSSLHHASSHWRSSHHSKHRWATTSSSHHCKLWIHSHWYHHWRLSTVAAAAAAATIVVLTTAAGHVPSRGLHASVTTKRMSNLAIRSLIWHFCVKAVIILVHSFQKPSSSRSNRRNDLFDDFMLVGALCLLISRSKQIHQPETHTLGKEIRTICWLEEVE